MEPGQREQFPNVYNSSPNIEFGQNPGVEYDASAVKIESTQERAPAPVEASPVPIQQTLPPIQNVVVSGQDDNSAAMPATSDDSSIPLVANDDDLIEKEWVDKAKKIIAETKDDPYRREIEIGKLQIEYIRKRYGREIGQSED